MWSPASRAADPGSGFLSCGVERGADVDHHQRADERDQGTSPSPRATASAPDLPIPRLQPPAPFTGEAGQPRGPLSGLGLTGRCSPRRSTVRDGSDKDYALGSSVRRSRRRNLYRQALGRQLHRRWSELFGIERERGCDHLHRRVDAFVVAKANPMLSWTGSSSITYGTSLGPAQLDASASVPGRFSYNPTSGTLLVPGLQPSRPRSLPATQPITTRFCHYHHYDRLYAGLYHVRESSPFFRCPPASPSAFPVAEAYWVGQRYVRRCPVAYGAPSPGLLP